MWNCWHLKNPVFQYFLVLKRLNKIKKIKNHSKPKLASQSCMKSFKQNPNIFLFFTQTLTPLFCVSHWVGNNTNQSSNSNILKTVKGNIIFTTQMLFKQYLISFLMICRLIDFALLVLKLSMSKICRIIGISKIKFFHFSSTEMVKQNQKSLKNN